MYLLLVASKLMGTNLFLRTSADFCQCWVRHFTTVYGAMDVAAWAVLLAVRDGVWVDDSSQPRTPHSAAMQVPGLGGPKLLH